MVAECGKCAEGRLARGVSKDICCRFRMARRFADVIAAEKQQVGRGGYQRGNRARHVRGTDERADVGVGHEADAESAGRGRIFRYRNVDSVQYR